MLNVNKCIKSNFVFSETFDVSRSFYFEKYTKEEHLFI